jgi:prophage antirepressor-like protein
MKEGKNKLILIFEDQPVRRAWDEKAEKWYFSVVDVVRVLTDSVNPRDYWFKMKIRVKGEDKIELSTICRQLKLLANDGKKYLTDVSDVEGILRIIQSIPSPKAEPFKRWLAKVGYERMQETVDPELAVNRGRNNWQAMGRSKKWIEQRMLGVETRNKLTDYWADHGIETPDEYAKLTNIIHREWSGLTVKSHKNLKNLKQENLRDHMDEAELIFTALAELSTRRISEAEKAQGYDPNEKTARKGGKVSGNARRQLEKETGKKVVNDGNYLEPKKRIKKIKK